MYDLEKQVCLLEQGRNLKNLNVIADSYFAWVYRPTLKEWQLIRKEFSDLHSKFYPAYTCAELFQLWKSGFKSVGGLEEHKTHIFNTLAIGLSSDQPFAHILADRIIYNIDGTKIFKAESLKF